MLSFFCDHSLITSKENQAMLAWYRALKKEALGVCPIPPTRGLWHSPTVVTVDAQILKEDQPDVCRTF